MLRLLEDAGMALGVLGLQGCGCFYVLYYNPELLWAMPAQGRDSQPGHMSAFKWRR